MDYFSSTYPEPWQILGLKLRPFSFGHYFKLQRLGCAFVSDKSETATLGDLLLGVLVCTLPSDPDAAADPFWAWLNREHGGWRYRLYVWLAKLLRKPPLSPAEWDVFRLGQQIGPFDFGEKVRLFADYIKHHSEAPLYFEEPRPQSSKRSGAHWAHAIVHTVAAKCGYTLDQAYNAPMAQVLADYFRYAETEGAVRLMTPDEVEFTEAWRAKHSKSPAS